MAPRHSARLSPIQPETVWTLEDGVVFERRGGHERRFDLKDLKAVRRAERGAVLIFGRKRLTLPALSYEGLRPRDRSESFEAFMSAMPGVDALSPRSMLGRAPVYWTMGLMGLGAAALLIFAVIGGALSLGLALAARLIFVMLLAGAALPWLDRPAR